MRLLLLPLAALVAATGVAAATPAQRVTISAQPTDLARDRRLTLYGSIPTEQAREIVVLEARDCGQRTYREVARVPTTVGGRYSWEFFYPGITATIRAVWKGNRSAPVRVRDRAFVELRPRGAGAFVVSVRARMGFVGKRAVLQRLTQSGWKRIATATLTEAGVPPGAMYVSSTGRAVATVPEGSLVRAVFPRAQARPCYLAGYSNMLRT